MASKCVFDNDIQQEETQYCNASQKQRWCHFIRETSHLKSGCWLGLEKIRYRPSKDVHDLNTFCSVNEPAARESKQTLSFAVSITRSFSNVIYSFFTQGSWVSSLDVGRTNYSPVANGHFLQTRSLTFQRAKWAFFIVLRQVKRKRLLLELLLKCKQLYLRRLLRLTTNAENYG